MPRESPKRHWLITSYEDDFDKRMSVDGICHPLLSYCVGQQECCPTTQKVHWQAYIVFKTKVRLTSVKSLCGNSVHAEDCKGTPLECKTYCTKEESRLAGGRSFEFGDFPGKDPSPASKSLEEACQLLREGSTMTAIAEAYPTTFVRNNRGLVAFMKAIRPRPPPVFRPVTVWILWGDAGAGKTRAVFHWLRESGKTYHRKAYTKGQPSWWDGYLDQEVLILDDFEGERCGCSVEEFLNLTDGYAHTRSWPVKGDFVYLDNVKTIFITSNTDPTTWYSFHPEKHAAVARRCTNVFHITTGIEWFNIQMPEVLKHVTPDRSESQSPGPRRRTDPSSDALPAPILQGHQTPDVDSGLWLQPFDPLTPMDSIWSPSVPDTQPFAFE